ncbi:MAG: TRAP transporter small permease subunit [Desulfobacterales bacterium]
MNAVWKFIQLISDKMRLVGAAMLVAMTLLTCTDVAGRLFKHPVFGTIELISLMGALAVAMALPDTHAFKGHIGVEVIVNKFSRRTRAVIEFFTGLLSLILFSIVTWKMLEYSVKMRESGEVSMNLGLPEYMIIFVVGIGFVVFSLIIVKDLADTFNKLRGK